MKKVGIIGANGMLGSDLSFYLEKKFLVVKITKDTYSQHLHEDFDILINANGNSKRFWANENPLKDFSASTESVYKSLFDFSYNQYVYISSSDVYENHTKPRYTSEKKEINSSNLSSYGLHKYISELLIKKYCKNYRILRCSMMLGRSLKKGPVYDCLTDKALFITPSSNIQMITTEEIVNVIERVVLNDIHNDTFNIGGKGTVPIKKLGEYIQKKVSFSSNAQLQEYEMSIVKLGNIFSLKTSIQYLQDFIKMQRLNKNRSM